MKCFLCHAWVFEFYSKCSRKPWKHFQNETPSYVHFIKITDAAWKGIAGVLVKAGGMEKSEEENGVSEKRNGISLCTGTWQ